MKINKLSWAVAYKIDKRTQDDGTIRNTGRNPAARVKALCRDKG